MKTIGIVLLVTIGIYVALSIASWKFVLWSCDFATDEELLVKLIIKSREKYAPDEEELLQYDAAATHVLLRLKPYTYALKFLGFGLWIAATITIIKKERREKRLAEEATIQRLNEVNDICLHSDNVIVALEEYKKNRVE